MIVLKWFKRQKLVVQIIFYFVILIFVISVALINLMFINAKKQIENTYISVNRSNLETYDRLFDMYISNIIDSLRNKLYETDFLRELKNVSLDENAYYYNAYLKTRILRYMADNMYITGVFIYDSYGRYVYATNYRSNSLVTAYMRYNQTHNIESEEWYYEANAADGKEIFVGYNPVSNEVSNFSLCKAILDPNTLQRLGVIVVSIRSKMLEDIPINMNEQYSSYSFFIERNSDHHELIYSRTAYDRELFDIYLNQIKQPDLVNSEYIFTVLHNKSTNWNLVTCVRRRDLSSNVNLLASAILFAIILIITAALFLTIIISRYVTKPLRKLQNAIQEYSVSNSIISDTFDSNEIGEISTFVKNAVNSNLELNQKVLDLNIREKEMEILALQSQINPHFLYNTLDSLYLKSIIHGEEEIADMVSALSDMFKITLNNGKNYIELSDELTYIDKYIFIQNIRFSNKIHYHLFVDEQIQPSSVYLLKFLIQPFVENAVIHGFEPNGTDFNIFINICIVSNDNIKITIVDDGIGVEDPTAFHSGYGINNIRERLRLFYGCEYELHCESKIMEGTKIDFMIPRTLNLNMKS